VKNGGHTPNMSKPEQFNCALEKFLKNEDMETCHQISEAGTEEK